MAARVFLTLGALLPYWRLLTFSVVFVTDDYFASDIFNGELPGRVLVGQLIRITSDERKVLLAAGAAAGMAATFGCPVAAVLLAIELLLFEYRARSLVPVAFAAVTAQAMRIAALGAAPVFGMPTVASLSGGQVA